MINFSLHPKDSPITELNGPGKRIPLWVQGCSICCTKECISPASKEQRPNILLSIDETLTIIRKRFSDNHEIEGITLLGGEPMDQAQQLSRIAKEIRLWGFTVMTYTGYTWEYLQQAKNKWIKKLLLETDLLKAGPYDSAQKDNSIKWRGSSNQTLHALSQRYQLDKLINKPFIKGVDVSITSDGRLIISGCQDRNVLINLESELHRKNIVIL